MNYALAELFILQGAISRSLTERNKDALKTLHAARRRILAAAPQQSSRQR
jgi:hypothetical protein